MIEIRTPTADDYPAMGRQIHESFGASEPEELERKQVLVDFDRFHIAYDTVAQRLVGVSGSWAMEITLPGGDLVPMGGVTWVAVAPTHRRQGILTRMLWLKVLDVADVFGLRRYGIDDDMVIDIGGRRWSVGTSGCTRVRRRPDLVIDPGMLGALVLGGVSPQTLHAGHRLDARSPEALR